MIIWFVLSALLLCLYAARSLDDVDFVHHLSTKTPYRIIENSDTTEIKFEGCVAKKIWSVIRHGTRTPGEIGASLMQSRLFVIRDLILKYNKHQDQFANFVVWKPHSELDGEKTLTLEGESEMISLAQRLQQRFPTLLSKPWNNATYLFRFTDTSRTRASARHFTRGLFGEKKANNVWYPLPLKKDPILRFYKLCEKWRMKVKKNSQSLNELQSFLRGDIMTAVLANITKRFNLSEGELSVDDVQLIYTTCCFETAWNKRKTSPWCYVLTQQEFEILEYAEDLEYYWIDGYGYELTTKMGCVMLNDAFNYLKSNEERKATFYFTHSGTILKFLSHLGLYQVASKLRHDNFVEQTQRLWRTSLIDTFASNIAFVLFNCTDGEYVLTTHQERPVILPGCPLHKTLCSLSHLERLYERSRLHCDFDEICRNDSEEKTMDFFVNKLWMAYETLKMFYFI